MESILNTQEPKPASAPRSEGRAPLVLSILAGGLAVVVLGLAAFLFVQLRDARTEIAALQARVKELATQASGTEKKAKELDDALASVQGQTATIAERVGVTAAELQRTAAAAAAAARQLREEQRKGQESLAELGGEVGKVKGDVEASKAAIEQTQAQLQRAIGDLGEQSGLIARNADELASLKRTGLRDYSDFDVKKSKQPSRVGAVAVRLTSADAKKNKFSMVLVVDDLQIEKKDKTLLEPVQFYRKGSRQLHEIVVYTIAKDRIVGYLSAPKAAEAPPR